MSKFMFMSRQHGLLFVLFIIGLNPGFTLAATDETFQSPPVKALGTGLTTGHVADLVIKNKGKTAMNILPQRVFIPSSGQYQPYIADIPATFIRPDSTVTLKLMGYCTDVHLPAAPAALELIPIEKWIPIRQPDSTLVGKGYYLVTRNSVVPFTKDHIGYIITSTAYSPLYPPPDSMNIATWPGTDLPEGGSINHIIRPDLYATIMARVLELLETGSTAIQQRKNFSTPFTIQPEKEREAIIQQVIWMYASALMGKKYGKEDFRNKVYEQFKTRSSLSEMPALEKQELDEGIDEFWNVFQTVATEAGLFISKDQLSTIGVLVDLPVDTIRYPWSLVSMIDIIMKPGFVKYIPIKVSNPVIPILAGATSLGTLLYIAFHEHSGDTDCVFSVALQSTPSACNLETGTILLTTSVDADYAYLWSNGATTKNLIGVAPGNYSVTVTRTGTTCGQSAQAEVGNINLPINTSIITTDAHCGKQDGTAMVDVVPQGVYGFAWSNGSTDQNQNNLAAGDYTLIITASGTCADTNQITINDLPAAFNVQITNTPAHCGAADGSATAGVDPPGDYLFQWSDGSSSGTVSGLSAGSYSVTVTDQVTGCAVVEQTDIDASSSSFQIDVSTTDASCGLADGTASATIDPPGEYHFEWSNGQSSSQVTGLAPGEYSLTVSIPGEGCIDSIQFTIGQLLPAFTINATNTPASCGLSDGTASISVDPPGTYEFNWSNGQTGSALTGLSPGIYTVSVSVNGNLCVETTDVNISQLPPSFTISSATSPASCGLEDGTATALVDPPGEYIYLWSNGQTMAQASDLAPGNYDVTVTIPGTSCQQNISITVDQLPPSFTVNTSSTAAHCGLNDGTATVMVDPPGEYNYLWSDGQITMDASGLAEGNYTVTVTIPGTSCQQSISVTIDQEAASFTVSATSTPAQCGMDDGSANTMVDPPGEYMYQWSGGQTESQLSGLGAGQYIVSVSLVGSSCNVVDTIVVDQLPLNLSANFDITMADCGLANGGAVIHVDPVGAYTYIWSNQQSGDVLQQVPVGNYDVTVTDLNSCSASFSTSIGENPVHYLDILSTIPATCLGGGEISIILSGPGDGSFSVDINAPGGPINLILAAGSYSLSAFLNIVPGTYSISVYNQSIGQACSDMQSTQVDDQTPGIITINDTYLTQSDQPVSGNVLQNDSGLNLQLVSVDNIIGGAVNFAGDGSFTYTPTSGFNGTGSFTYTVMDACGNTATGSAVITVQLVACTFTISSILIPANCDLSNGSISVSVNEPGNYQYSWNNGQSGSAITNIPAGNYTVTITETGSGCMENFTLSLSQYPASYVSNIIITQPSCANAAEIQFTLNTQGSVPFLTVSVDHPNGLQTFTIEPGVVELSDYVDIVQGAYTIEVFIGDAGPNCIDDFSANINAAPSVAIQTGQIFPPSAPGAFDGMVNINVTDPGITPYSIYVNGGFFGTTSNQNFQVTGLMTGIYDIHIVDAAGCVSNTVTVIIPLPNIIFSLGVAFTNSPLLSEIEQPANVAPSFWSTAVLGSIDYQIRKRTQQLRVLYSPGVVAFKNPHPAWMQIENLSEIFSLHQKWSSFSLHGGLGFNTLATGLNYDPCFITLNANTKITIGKILYLQTEMAFRGWSKLEPPQWMISASVPFLK